MNLIRLRRIGLYYILSGRDGLIMHDHILVILFFQQTIFGLQIYILSLTGQCGSGHPMLSVCFPMLSVTSARAQCEPRKLLGDLHLPRMEQFVWVVRWHLKVHLFRGFCDG